MTVKLAFWFCLIKSTLCPTKAEWKNRLPSWYTWLSGTPYGIQSSPHKDKTPAVVLRRISILSSSVNCCLKRLIICQCISFNPIIEIIRVEIKNNLQKLDGSLKKRIPTITVPTAPIPVQTGYAVPIGIVCTAFANSVMLRVRHTMNPNPQRHHGVPDNPFILPRQNAKPVSKHPAIIRRIQFIKLKKCPIEGCSYTRRLLPRLNKNAKLQNIFYIKTPSHKISGPFSTCILFWDSFPLILQRGL